MLGNLKDKFEKQNFEKIKLKEFDELEQFILHKLFLINESFDDFQNKKHGLHLEVAKFSRGWTAKKAKLVITPSQHLSTIVHKWGVKKKNLKVI